MFAIHWRKLCLWTPIRCRSKFRGFWFFSTICKRKYSYVKKPQANTRWWLNNKQWFLQTAVHCLSVWSWIDISIESVSVSLPHCFDLNMNEIIQVQTRFCFILFGYSYNKITSIKRFQKPIMYPLWLNMLRLTIKFDIFV